MVDFILKGKGKFDKAQLFGRSIVAFKGVGGAGVAAGVCVQGKADGVEQGGLAGAGRSADQKQPVLKAGKINIGLPGVGTKGGKAQMDRAHRQHLLSFYLAIGHLPSAVFQLGEQLLHQLHPLRVALLSLHLLVEQLEQALRRQTGRVLHRLGESRRIGRLKPQP